LIAEREEELQSQKFKIGVLCAGILEKPEEKIKNLNVLLRMLDERDKEGQLNFLPIRKLVMLSLVEIFKDILPEYRVGKVDLEHQKGK
jgi:nucleolar complex protein 3